MSYDMSYVCHDYSDIPTIMHMIQWIILNLPQQVIRTELNICMYTVTDLIMLRYKLGHRKQDS